MKLFTYFGYAMTALRNWKRIMAWISEGKSIAREFGMKFPDEEKKPTASDVIGAAAESTAGKTTFTAKKVRDWTPAEWKNYWDRGSGTGQW